MNEPNGAGVSLNKIRTYAKDLDNARNLRNNTKGNTLTTAEQAITVKEESVKAPVSKVVVPKPVAIVKKQLPKTFSNQTKTDTTPELKPIPSSLTESLANVNHKKSIIVDTTDGAAATIITDTKRNRFRLIPAISAAIKKWFEKEKKALTVKKVPKYTVPDSSLRKGVIQKATSKTGRFATADFDSIQERIKKRNEVAEEESTTIWTPHTETGFYLLEAPEPTPISNVQVVAKKSFISPVVTPSEPETAPSTEDNRWGSNQPETPTTTPIIQAAPAPEMVEITTTPSPVAIPEVPVIATKTEEEEPVTIVTTAETPDSQVTDVWEEIPTNYDNDEEYKVPVTLIKESPESEETPTPVPLRELLLSTNILTLTIASVAIIFIAIGTIFVLQPEETVTTKTNTIEAILEPAQIEEMGISNLDLDSLKEAFTTFEARVEKTTELVPTVDGTEVTAANTITAIYPDADVSFVHAIKKVHLGYSAEQVPFIIMEYKDEKAVYGGMLVWEHSLASDLAPILHNNTKAGDDGFIDDQVGGYDIRHTTKDGQDTLVYGLIDGVIIITTDTLTLESLIPLIK